MQCTFVCLTRHAMFFLAVLVLSWAATAKVVASELVGYSRAFEDTNPHLRTASAYLRTGNIDLAALELENYLNKWAEFSAGNEKVRASVEAAHRDVADALALIDAGKPDNARDILARVRAKFRDFHLEAGLEFFADCIFDADAAGLPLWVNRHDKADLDRTEDVARVRAEASRYKKALAACNGKAPAVIASDPEFRRLMDGSLLSLTRIPATVDDKDAGLLHRLLIELRAFARLLVFRYG